MEENFIKKANKFYAVAFSGEDNKKEILIFWSEASKAFEEKKDF